MSDLCVLTGIVLKAQPVGETDKRLTILTAERGKIGAFAKGARRLGSPLMAGSRMLASGKYECYEGRTSYTVRSIDPIDFFEDLSTDPETVCFASYFAELADRYTRESGDERRSLILLYQALRALRLPKIPNRLVRCVYEFKTMVLNGEYTLTPPLKVREETAYALSYIAGCPEEKLFSFLVAPEVLTELEACMKVFREKFLDRDFHSLSVLEEMLALTKKD